MEIKNRIAMAPMGTQMYDDGFVTDRLKAYTWDRRTSPAGPISRSRPPPLRVSRITPIRRRVSSTTPQPREMSVDEIAATTVLFAAAAVRATQAGFDRARPISSASAGP